MKRITGVECPKCKKRMFSFYRHDYKVCGCPNGTMVDGGRDYLRYGWRPEAPGGKRPRIIRWCKRDGKYPLTQQEVDEINSRDRWPY